MQKRTIAVAIAIALTSSPLAAQDHDHIKLHVNPRWKECSFQLDATLTQAAWHQFTQEAGLVAYFRPLTDARPMGRGNFEVSMLQWSTNIDDDTHAWNDTFVHPDSTHWLKEGKGLKFPGLTARMGVTSKTDLGVYFTKNPNANYGFYGVQVQQNLFEDASSNWNVSARGSLMKLYGPEDLDFTTYGADLLVSRRIAVSKWIKISPYVGVSSYLTSSHEKSPVVNLADEHVGGGQAMLGAEVQFSKARFAAEYNFSRVNSFSMKVGIAR